MTLTLHNLSSQRGAGQKRKRVGRGNASGHGTYSTRGLKGQKSRSGVSGLKRLGMKKQLLAIPKLRGFKSHHPKNQVVNLVSINERFQDGQKINPRSLLAAGLIAKIKEPVKILARGQLTLKQLTFEGVIFSRAAAAQLPAVKNKTALRSRATRKK